MRLSTCLKFSLLCVANACNFPNPDFLRDVSILFGRSAIAYHCPWMEKAKIIRYAASTLRDWPQQFSFQKPDENETMLMSNEDLHVFIIGNVASLEAKLNARTRANREFWLIDVTPLQSMDLLQNLTLDIDDDIYLYHWKDDIYHVQEAYKLSPELDLIVKNFGNWSMQKGLEITHLNKWERRGDLTGYHFKVATVASIPYITDMIPTGPETYKMYGMFAEVFDNLQSIMNFTYDLYQPPDGQWGAIQPDNTWSGMVGMLSRGEIDMAATDFTVTKERSAVMTFANPITQIYHSLFIKNPVEAYNFSAFTEPMHYLSWIVVLSFIVFAPPILFMNVRFPQKDPIAGHEFTLAKSYVYICSTLTMRGWSEIPVKPAGKIALFSLLYFGTLMYWHWEAMLISYLSTRVTVLPFGGIPELISTSPFRIILTPGSSYEDAFKTSRDPDWMAAWVDRVQPHLQEFEGMRAAKFAEVLETDTDSALYDNYFSVISLKQYTECKIIAIPAKYDFKPYAYGFQKDSPFLDLFNFYLKEMREKGSMKQILEKYQPPEQVCPDYSGKPLGFGAVFTAFVILCLGAGIALILFSLEIIAETYGKQWNFLHWYSTNEEITFDESRLKKMLIIKENENRALREENHILKSRANGFFK